MNADFEGQLMLEQIQSKMTRTGKIMRTVAGARLLRILTKGDVKHPMAVLNMPMGAHRVEYACRTSR